MNFILFKVTTESYSKWVNLRVTKTKYEFIIDFGFWRVYVH